MGRALGVLLALGLITGAASRLAESQTAPAAPSSPDSPTPPSPPPPPSAPSPPIFPFTARATEIIERSLARDAAPARAIVRISIERPLAAGGALVLRALDGKELSRAAIGAGEAGRVLRLPVPLPPAGGVLPIDVELAEGEALHRLRLEVPAPDPEWVLWLLPAASAVPVGWLPQRDAVETGEHLPAPLGSVLDLLDAHLDLLAVEPELRATFSSLPLLGPFLSARPWRRDDLLAAVADAQVEIAGGGYGEVASPLVGLETIVRGALHGTHWKREALGAELGSAWHLGGSGHDPGTPSLAHQLGLTSGAIGRGPFLPGTAHAPRSFPSEFLWLSPDGEGILAHASGAPPEEAHEALARGTAEWPHDPEAAAAAIADLFEERRGASLTRQVLVPVALDFAPPLANLADAVAAWNAAHASPRVVIGVPAQAFAAVEAEIVARGIIAPAITRDMTPPDAGRGSSDLRIALRAAETTLHEAELYATIAAIEGAEYPHRRLDRAWRQLFFLSQPAAIEGSLSDQAAIDLLWAARDAYEIARTVRFAALCHLAGKVGGEGPLLWNPTAQPRDGYWLADDVQDGRRTSLELSLPALGVRRVAERPPAEAAEAAADTSRPVLLNEHLRVELDLSLGGAIVSLIDRATGEELLDGPGNDLVVTEAGGARRSGTGVAARLLSGDRDRPHRLEIEARAGEFSKRQSIELLPGARRIDFETQILRYRGRDQLLSVVFPLRHPGARPVFATATAAIGRPAAPDEDGAGSAAPDGRGDHPCTSWVELGRVAAIEIVPGDGAPVRRGIGAGEIVIGAAAGAERQTQANDLARALVTLGVTTTITREDARRHGDPAIDASLPDFRILLGGGDEIAGVASLESAGLPAETGGGCRYVEPGSGLPGVDLPTILLSGDASAQQLFLASLARDRAVVIPGEVARLGPGPSVADRGIALVHHGAFSCRVGADGTIALHLLASSAEWPAGEWPDEPSRAHPDGSPIGAMHGSHRFRYSLIPHPGDHREAEIAARANEVLHPPLRQLYRAGDGSIEDGRSWLSIEPASVLLTAMKPAGYDLARLADDGERGPLRAVSLRLSNGAGRPVEAIIRPGFVVTRAETTDLLETVSRELPIGADGALRLSLAPWELRTVRLALEPPAGETRPLDLPPVGAAPSSPWLEGRGEGAEGGGVLSLAPRERDLVLAPEGGGTTLRVASFHRARAITVPLTVRSPAGLDVVLDPPQVILGPGEQADVRLSIIPREPWRGRALIEIVAAQAEGAVAAAVWVRAAGVAADAPAVEIIPAALLVPPRGELRATVRNLTDGPLRGELAWISSHAAWDAIPRWREELDLPPRGEVAVSVRLSSPIDGFALPRFTAGGEVIYGECFALLENPAHTLLSFDVERARISESGIGVANLVARSLRGLTAETDLGIRAPAGWQVEEIARVFTPAEGEGEEQRLDVSLAIAVEGDAAAGPIVAAGPAGARASVETARVPVVRARASGASVDVDGDLSEWDDAEFVSAEGEGGRLRLAVRHDPAGLVFAFAVADEVHRQTRSGAGIGEGDAVRIALTAAPQSSIGFGRGDLEIGAASTPHGPEVWCWSAGSGGRPGPAPESTVAVRSGRAADGSGEVRTELRLPLGRLAGLPLSPGAILGFAAAWHDDDGERGGAGRASLPATEWSGGLLGVRDASRFGELHLLE